MLKYIIPFWIVMLAANVLLSADGPSIHPDRFGIRVVDNYGRGVPLVELRTVNNICCVTDNAGWIAWDEPGMMDREVFWHVSGPGIEREKDGFGFRGFRALTKRGQTTVCSVTTTNIATRICRLTGQGLYRESELLGLEHPVSNIMEPSVLGQDSVQAVLFDEKIFWLWGDTNQARYPLGNFHTTCATTPKSIDLEKGVVFQYYRDPANSQLLRRMMPTTQSGVVWMFGLMTVRDQERERMFAGFSRRPGLEPAHEQGIAEWNADEGHFQKVADISKDNEWGFPHGHAVRAKTAEGDHVYFCRPFAHVRVAANANSIVDPKQYELLQWDSTSQSWTWRFGTQPTTQKKETQLIESGEMPIESARFRLKAANAGRDVTLHTASIVWNDFRKRFVLIGLEITNDKASPSHLGEVWYAESESIAGPWAHAVKVASHPNYSFYNPVHHSFFDREGGRIIYFEGTYTNQFSGNPMSTARYEYNQVLYRLDLSDVRLAPAQSAK